MKRVRNKYHYRIVSIFLVSMIILMLMGKISVVKADDIEKKEVNALLEKYSISVASNAIIETNECVTKDGQIFDVIEVTENFGYYDKTTAYMFYELDEEGKEQWVSVSNNEAGASSRAISAGTRNYVTASAYYQTMTVSGKTVYKPYKIEAVSSKTVKDGVFSPWNGQRPTWRVPFLFN